MAVVEKGKPIPPADIYILHGDDLLATGDRIAGIIERLREKGLADTDITHMDGRSAGIRDLSVNSGMLLLGGSMRLLVVEHALDLIKDKADQEWVISWLGSLPPDQALILILPDSWKFNSKTREWGWQQAGKSDWLVAALKEIPRKSAWMDVKLPSEKEMAGWIMEEAKRQGVVFEPHAAAVLASQTGNDLFTVRQEVRKALDYTNGERVVTADDVRLLCAVDRETGVFDMLDAVGRRDGRTALGLLHRLLQETTPANVFYSLARHVRQLIMAKDVVGQGGSDKEIASECGIQAFVARKLVEQCRRFRMEELEALYHRLDLLDEESKLSQASLEAGMEVLVARISQA